MPANLRNFLTATALLALGLAAPGAYAALLLAASVNGANVCASDQNVGCGWGAAIADTNPTVNELGLGSAAAGINVAGVQVFGSLSRAIYGPPLNILSSASLTVENTNAFAVTITVAVSATGFIPPSSLALTTGSGTFILADGGTIELRWFNDPTNAQGAETPLDTPGLLVDSFSFAATGDASSFSHNGGPFAVSDPDPYSMTLWFEFTLPAGARLISRGQSEIKNVGGSDIPEPATLLLVGAGLVLLALMRRRVH